MYLALVFWGRSEELAALHGAWERARDGDAQLVVVTGRRRVGKTFLLQRFLQQLPSDVRRVHHQATLAAEPSELRRLAEDVERDLGEQGAVLAGGPYTSWDHALRRLVAAAEVEPLVVVLDEVPYLESVSPGWATVLQAVWDRERHERRTQLLLVLCGSAVSVMEGLLGGGGALYARASRTLRMEPFDLPTVAGVLADLPAEDVVQAYAACGGWPLHLRAWDAGEAVDENLLRLAGTAGGLLLEDARVLLRELPSQPGYHRVLTAIGQGATRRARIVDHAGQRVDHPLQVLLDTGYVRRETPVGAPAKADPLYTVGDPYLRFWFAVLSKDAELIAGGQGAQVLGRQRPAWEHHVAQVFEEGARAHAGRLVARGRLPQDLVIGRWWASSREPVEVDVLGLRGGHSVLLGEAKWAARPLGRDVLAGLRRAVARVPDPDPDPLLALWGRRGVAADAGPPGGLAFGADDVVDRV